MVKTAREDRPGRLRRRTPVHFRLRAELHRRVVKDATGAVMPGVTVEASSPALIEKARSVVTDGQGCSRSSTCARRLHRDVHLEGFNTIKREGIELTAATTATINGDMRIGALEESVTVSAQAALVDVQNVVQNREVTREVMDAIPTGTDRSSRSAC